MRLKVSKIFLKSFANFNPGVGARFHDIESSVLQTILLFLL